ncbi:MAG: DPP IV N-terminal domain-containing protein, partial [Chitinivibrionales bacterium]|nr:DPP IV N-terminal domain-containing protein [Chitinivibrionales bacterium]
MLLAVSVFGFGQNKVQYKNLAWRVIDTKHLSLYYYQDQAALPEISGRWLEESYEQLAKDFSFTPRDKIPCIIYGHPAQFSQTNIVGELLPEGVGGFTTHIKNRVVVPFDGSYNELRHVLHHELTHGFQNAILFSQPGSSLFAGGDLEIPLWFAEGSAEFLSSGWDGEADMFLMDAAIYGSIPKPGPMLGGYMAYKGGQSFLFFLSESRGAGLFGRFLTQFRISRNIERACKDVYGKNLDELGEEWQQELKRIYWPETGRRELPADVATPLTDHVKSKAFYNLRPRIAPDGKKIAFFSDLKDYTHIFIAGRKGKIVADISSAGTTGHFESFHPFRSGLCWSPHSDRLAFVAEHQGRDEIKIYSLAKKRVVKTIRTPLLEISSPDWSPDGNELVFCGIAADAADLYLYNLQNGALTRLTHDVQSESDPRFSPSGKTIVFAATDSCGLPQRFIRRPVSNLYLYNRAEGTVQTLTQSAWNVKSPCFS